MMANGYSDFFTRFIHYVGSAKPVDFMTFIADLSSNAFLPLGGLFLSLFVGYKWHKKKLYRELLTGTNGTNSLFIIRYVDIGLRFACPAILGVIFILTIMKYYFGIALIF